MEIEQQVVELAYAMDTFYFLVAGALVMWMAAGFTMLEAGMVRTKSVAEIATKNIALYSIASIMYMLIGYNIMYGDGFNSLIPSFMPILSSVDNFVEEVLLSDGEIIADDAPALLTASPLFAPQMARLFPEQGWLTVEEALGGIRR